MSQLHIRFPGRIIPAAILLFILAFINFCCTSDPTPENESNYIKVKIGSTTVNGTTLVGAYDDNNYYSLSDRQIFFVGDGGCFNYGGLIYFTNATLANISYITAFACSSSYTTQVSGSPCSVGVSTGKSSVTITRNDNQVGGIIEGTITGLLGSCRDQACNCYYYYDLSCQFRLAIKN